MEQWVLILTLLSYDGHAITVLPRAFGSKRDCWGVGEAWVKQVQDSTKLNRAVPLFTCAKQ